MAGFMRKVAGYQDGGGVVDETLDGTGGSLLQSFGDAAARLSATRTASGTLASEEEEDVGGIGDVGLSKAEMARIGAIQDTYYKRAKETIKKAETGAPSQSEKWFAIAAALGQPTRTGSIGEQVAGVSKALGEYRSQKRVADSKRQSLLDQLELQQAKGLGDLQQKYIISQATQRGLNQRAGLKPINITNYTENNRQLQAKTFADGTIEIVDLAQNSPTFGQVIKTTRPAAGGPPAAIPTAPAGVGGPPAAIPTAPADKGPSTTPPPVELPTGVTRRTAGTPAAPAGQPAAPSVYAPTTFIRGGSPSFNVPGVGMVEAGATFKGPDGKPAIMQWDGVPKAIGDMSVADQLDLTKKKAQVEASFQGQKSMDEKYAPQYLDWKQNKRAVSLRNIDTIQGVVDLLKLQVAGKGAPISGFWSLGMLPDKLRAYAGPKGLDAQQTVEQAVSQGIKDVLDSQFAAAEAAQYMRRAYDPNLPPAMNIKKLEAYLTQARSGFNAKTNLANYWEKKQTLEGFKGAGVPEVLPPMPANPVVGKRYASASGRPVAWVIDPKTNKGNFVYLDR